MPLTIVEGWTGVIRMACSDANGRADLTGADVALRLYDKVHDEVIEAGTVTVEIAVSGEISFAPSGVDFVRADSPYYARVSVVDVLGKQIYFPSDDTDVWTVRGVGP